MRYPFFRSYRVNLPSSFNIILSSALVYSTSPPVSDLVRFLSLKKKMFFQKNSKTNNFNFLKTMNLTYFCLFTLIKENSY